MQKDRYMHGWECRKRNLTMVISNLTFVEQVSSRIGVDGDDALPRDKGPHSIRDHDILGH